MASVVRTSVQRWRTAFCRAVRVTFVGSMTPAFDQVFVDAGSGVVAEVGVLRFVDLADDDRTLFACVGMTIMRSGSSMARRMMFAPIFSSPSSVLDDRLNSQRCNG